MPLPHMSLVQGKENVEFLKKRHETMTKILYLKEWNFLMTLKH